MEHLSFALLQLLLSVVAWSLASLGFHNGPREHKLFATVCLFGILATATMQWSGAFGTPHSGMLLTVFALASAGLLWARAKVSIPTSNGQAQQRPSLLSRISLGLWLGSLGFSVLLFARLGTTFCDDDLGYHATLAMQWLRDGHSNIGLGTFADYYPANTELLAAWFCLAHGTDTFGGLAGIYLLVLIASALASVARTLGAPSWTGLLLASGFATSSLIAWNVRTFSATDFGVAAMLLAAVAAFARMVASGSFREALGPAIVAGLACGFLAGAKVSAIPILPPLALLALGFCHPLGFNRVLRLALVIAAGTTALGSYWYCRNWILTGNPVFPGETGPFFGPLDKEFLSTTTLWPNLVGAPSSAEVWAQVARQYLNWPFSLGAVAVVGYGFGLSALFRRHLSTECRFASIALLLAGTGSLAFHPFVPWSEGPPTEVGQPLILYPRYILPSFACGIGLYLGLLRGTGWSAITMSWVALIAVILGISDSPKLYFACIGAGMGVVAMHALARQKMPIPKWRPAWSVVVGAILCFGLSLGHGHLTHRTDKSLFLYGDAQRPVGHLWNAVDQLPDGSRIAHFSNMEWNHYPYGRRPNGAEPVAFHLGGQPKRPLHEEFRSGLEPQSQSLVEFAQHLEEAQIDFLVLTPWAKASGFPGDFEAWLPELRAQTETVFDDGYSLILRLP